MVPIATAPADQSRLAQINSRLAELATTRDLLARAKRGDIEAIRTLFKAEHLNEVSRDQFEQLENGLKSEEQVLLTQAQQLSNQLSQQTRPQLEFRVSQLPETDEAFLAATRSRIYAGLQNPSDPAQKQTVATRAVNYILEPLSQAAEALGRGDIKTAMALGVEAKKRQLAVTQIDPDAAFPQTPIGAAIQQTDAAIETLARSLPVVTPAPIPAPGPAPAGGEGPSRLPATIGGRLRRPGELPPETAATLADADAIRNIAAAISKLPPGSQVETPLGTIIVPTGRIRELQAQAGGGPLSFTNQAPMPGIPGGIQISVGGRPVGAIDATGNISAFPPSPRHPGPVELAQGRAGLIDRFTPVSPAELARQRADEVARDPLTQIAMAVEPFIPQPLQRFARFVSNVTGGEPTRFLPVGALARALPAALAMLPAAVERLRGTVGAAPVPAPQDVAAAIDAAGQAAVQGLGQAAIDALNRLGQGAVNTLNPFEPQFAQSANELVLAPLASLNAAATEAVRSIVPPVPLGIMDVFAPGRAAVERQRLSQALVPQIPGAPAPLPTPPSGTDVRASAMLPRGATPPPSAPPAPAPSETEFRMFGPAAKRPATEAALQALSSIPTALDELVSQVGHEISRALDRLPDETLQALAPSELVRRRERTAKLQQQLFTPPPTSDDMLRAAIASMRAQGMSDQQILSFLGGVPAPLAPPPPSLVPLAPTVTLAPPAPAFVAPVPLQLSPPQPNVALVPLASLPPLAAFGLLRR